MPMANYLERVASSAGRRAAIAKPPTSGPPVLPAGRDFSIAPADPFASDEQPFVETVETPAPARIGNRIEIPAAPGVAEESTTKVKQNKSVAAPVEPEPKPRPSVERLSDESPFIVHVPRTLRPSAIPKVPPTTANEPPRESPRVRASVTIGREESITKTEPLVEYAGPEVKESVTAEPIITAPPTPRVAASVEEHQAQVSVQSEAVLSDATPIPRVDRVDGPPNAIAHSAEPSPPPALPVPLPPVANNATRPEQSRISIGSLEVLVNNHPRVTTVRPAAPPSRTERLSLEKRYLDRFRLRY